MISSEVNKANRLQIDSPSDWNMQSMYQELARYERIAEPMRQLFAELTEKYCPLTLVFYRVNKPKLRNVKNPKTRMQNVNSYCSVCMLDFNEFGTIVRMVKHKGFPSLIAILDSTADEIYYREIFPRISRETYRHPEELGIKYQLTTQETSFLSDNYPSRAWGQLKGIFPP